MDKKISLIQVMFLLTVGILLWFIPTPADLSEAGWHLFVVFIIVILGIVTNCLPMGAMVLSGLVICTLTGIITIQQALNGFASHIVWLVITAFFIARAVIKSNFGKRVAYFLINKFGNSTLGLSYCLVLTEFLLSPAIPSAAARSGGIVFPVAKSISEQFSPKNSNKVKEFLMQVCFQANVISSAMFLTAMAGNPLIVKIAANFGINIDWQMWAVGAIMPGIANLLLMPVVLYYIITPKVESMEHMAQLAKDALDKMGSITRNEIIVLITFISLITLWMLSKFCGIDATTTALMGFLILVFTGVITWDDVVSEKEAWKTFIWFSGFITLSEHLSNFGVTQWIGANISNIFEGHTPYITFPALLLVFFYLHYLFASATVYASVMYSTFFLILSSLSIPPLVIAMILAFFTNISACLTHYGISSAPIFFTNSGMSIGQWWKTGLIVSVMNIAIWSFVGGAWWKIIGWW